MSAVRGPEAQLPTERGDFRVVTYVDGDVAHLALISGDLNDGTPQVRIHSECVTGDVFASARCDCGEQLHQALAAVASEGGVVIYLRDHEGRGTGIVNKIRAYQLMERGRDTVDANLELGLPIDARSYKTAVEILNDLGIDRVRLMTNNLDKCQALEQYDIVVEQRIPLESIPNEHNIDYLTTKRLRMGHLLENC